MQRRICLFILCFMIFPFAWSNTLSLKLSGELPRTVKQNIYAYLGELPENKRERSVFVFSANKKTTDALNALGYYQSSVTTSVDKGKESDKDIEKSHWTLSIDVVLNQPTFISKVNIVLVGEASEDSAFTNFISEAPIQRGDVLNHGIYEQLKENLLSLGLARGYFDSQFTQSKIAINKNRQTADIILHFNSGNRYQFGDVNFNEFDISNSVLQPLIPFKKGDYYQQTLLQNLQNELDKTQYFSNVVVRPDNNGDHNYILPIDVSLDKAKSHQLGVGLGYATDTKENFSLLWKTPLVNRYGHRQETKLSYSKINPTGHFIYSIPLTHANDDILQFKTVLEETDFADLTSRFFSFQVGRVYFDGDILRQPYLRYLNEEWNTDGIDESAKYFIPGLTWSDKEWQGSALDPSNGFRQYYNIEGSLEGFNSETSFFRFNARWKYIFSLSPKHRVVSRAELGYVLIKNDDADLSPSLRFYAGGDQSVRGFSYQSIGPKVTLSQGDNLGDKIVVGGTRMVVSSIEYQYYFTNEWRGALFSDAGSVNDESRLDLVYSIGTGVHYISPIGPIRFAVGFPLSESDSTWRVHFSIGTEL